MNDRAVPDAWPPSDARDRQGAVVPLFPLPNVFLFPGALMPLHIFEPRYRSMIEDSLDGPGRLVMGAVLESHHQELDGAPPVHTVAGLGEIARHERLPDGRFVIMLVGIGRVRIREIHSDRPYRKVEVVPMEELPVAPGQCGSLRGRLEKALLARTSDPLNLPADLPLGHLTDLLLMRLQLPQPCMQELYATASIAQRAELALCQHSRLPLPPST